MFRTAIRGTFAAVVFALALGVTTISSMTAATPAAASTCDSIYGSGNDMPGAPVTSSCPTATPTPPPPVVTPTPKPPVVTPKPTPRPPVITRVQPPRPIPAPVSRPVLRVVRHVAVRPPVPVHHLSRPAAPRVVKAAPKKVVAKKLARPACPATTLAPMVTTSFSFPWMLVIAFMALAGMVGGVFTTRAFMAFGHKWHPVLRRTIAGPDHHRITTGS